VPRPPARSTRIPSRAYLEDVDLSKFVGDDGEPTTKAIRPASSARRRQAADFDGGARTTAGRRPT
jgi:hypothetical protein